MEKFCYVWFKIKKKKPQQSETQICKEEDFISKLNFLFYLAWDRCNGGQKEPWRPDFLHTCIIDQISEREIFLGPADKDLTKKRELAERESRKSEHRLSIDLEA